MALLECIGVEKIYGGGAQCVHALNGVDLSVEKGEFVAIIGASGSGKSTLLHILGCVDRPTKGEVIVDGVSLGRLNATDAALFRRRRVGLIYQFYNLIPTLTVEQNMLLPLRLDRRAPEKAYFDGVVSALGIEGKLSSLPQQLSGGQQQRAAIARALMARPALLLADEPTGNLDKRNTQEIVELLKLSNRTYAQTLLLITHDERIADEADRVLTIEDGRIVRDERR